MKANDIQLLEKAESHKIGPLLKKRLRGIIDSSKDPDKIGLAIDYSHSVTKEEMRGSR